MSCGNLLERGMLSDRRAGRSPSDCRTLSAGTKAGARTGVKAAAKLALLSLAAASVVFFAGASRADEKEAYPKPSPFPVSWELSLKHSDPKRIVVQIPGQAGPTAFWYITYSVVNPSGLSGGAQAGGEPADTTRERIFFPSFLMRTHDGKLLPADDGIHPAVYDAINAQERNPHLEEPTQMGGRLLLGEDQQRDSVAIWPETTQRMGEFTIFAAGFWGETAPAKDSDGNTLKNAKGDAVLLHKTLLMEYHVDGDQFHFTPVRKTEEEFIMR